MWPELLRKIARCDRSPFAYNAIVVVEIAPLLKGQVDSSEVAGQLDQEPGAGTVFHIDRRAAFDLDVAPHGAHFRRRTYNRHLAHAGQGPKLSGQPVEEPYARICVGISRIGQVEAGAQNLTCRHLGVERKMIETTADEEPRTREQNQS